MSTWRDVLEANQAQYLEQLLDFLRIPSVSSLPEHAADVQQAGEWVAARMRQAGIENVEILPTGGHPVVYGDSLHAPGAPTVLVYGHFDTQPVDPLELWEHPPFEPALQGDRIYARGASDDKGNMLAPILAAEAILAGDGNLPVNVKYLFEGQEEIGSPQLPPFMQQHKDRFACDVVVSADGSQWAEDQPELPIGTRGLCALQVNVTGPAADLHSGIYGGTVQNPIHALSEILARLHDENGHIAVPGFYDQVRELTPEDKAKIEAVPFAAEEYRQRLGVPELYGEAGFSTHERAWARPTLEVNGIWGGFIQEGMKTVLPGQAHAKITCRLVPDQDPADIAQRVAAYVRSVAPSGVTVDAPIYENAAYPYLMPADHPALRSAEKVLTELYGKAPYVTRTGGSVPLYSLFLSELNAYTVTMSFGLPDEQIHSPNEFWRLSSFRRAQQAHAMVLYELGQADIA